MLQHNDTVAPAKAGVPLPGVHAEARRRRGDCAAIHGLSAPPRAKKEQAGSPPSRGWRKLGWSRSEGTKQPIRAEQWAEQWRTRQNYLSLPVILFALF